MGKHMLVHHMAIPLAVFTGLLLFGVPLAAAIGYALAAGCASMMLMMFTGHRHHGDHGGDHGHGGRSPAQHTTHADERR